MKPTQEEINAYLDKLTAADAARWKNNGAMFTIEPGRKYGRVVQTSHGQRFAFCFIDMQNGDLLKTATWSAPVKGARGNIRDENPPLEGRQFYKGK
jgi:hypothetical protein